MIAYSNPRMHAEIGNWPMGGSRRGTAIFDIEIKPGKGERGVRVTRRDDNHKLGKPALLTFAHKARIVDGDDGRTYIAELSSMYRLIVIMRGDMKYQAESFHEDHPRYGELLQLFA